MSANRTSGLLAAQKINDHHASIGAITRFGFGVWRYGSIGVERQFQPWLPFMTTSFRVFPSANLLYDEGRQQGRSRFHGAFSLFLM